jgi:predicted TIM-barrel fold metal-dependent hydrolase
MTTTANLWRQESPGSAGWARTVHPGEPNKYLMISTDTHITEPDDWWASRLPAGYAAQMPRIEVDADGKRWRVSPGRPRAKIVFHEDEGDDDDKQRVRAGRSVPQIIADMDRDGVDIQIAFPNKGLILFSQPDLKMMYALAGAYNDWLAETFSSVKDRVAPMAILPTADVDMAKAELLRVAKLGFFRGVLLPAKPIFGKPSADDANYNLPMYDPFWAALQDTGLAMTFHVSTGMDPRLSRGNGGAIINYACHALTSTVEPVGNLCASGVLERFPKLRFATIEAGIGWVPWFLEAMDEAYRKHYMWARPKLPRLPSEYYLDHGFSSFQEDPRGLTLAREGRYADCFMWANDYPHHEGTWPHSAAAIERQMGDLTEVQRTNILGGNAVRCFNLQDLAAKRAA